MHLCRLFAPFALPALGHFPDTKTRARRQLFATTTPFGRYGVYVSAAASAVTSTSQLEGCPFAISRRSSLSHVMTYLHATQSGWNPREWDATKSSLVEVGNLAGAREALACGRAQGLLWEKGTARPLVDSGEFRMVGECSPPWPSFVVAVREDMLTGENADSVRRLLDALDTSCRQFSRWGGRVGMVCERYGMRAEDARWRLQGIEWKCGVDSLAEVCAEPDRETPLRRPALDTRLSTAQLPKCHVCSELRPP